MKIARAAFKTRRASVESSSGCSKASAAPLCLAPAIPEAQTASTTSPWWQPAVWSCDTRAARAVSGCCSAETARRRPASGAGVVCAAPASDDSERVSLRSEIGLGDVWLLSCGDRECVLECVPSSAVTAAGDKWRRDERPSDAPSRSSPTPEAKSTNALFFEELGESGFERCNVSPESVVRTVSSLMFSVGVVEEMK
jgi:hypothetical protein